MLTKSRIVVGALIVVALLVLSVIVDRSYFKSVPYEETTTDISVQYEEARKSPFLVIETPLRLGRVVFVGDVMLARHVEQLMTRYGYDYPYRGFAFGDSEPTPIVANFEASIPPRHRPTPNYTFSFSVATRTLLMLKGSGISHVSLANNHSNDFGQIGFEHTNEALRSSGIVPFGKPSGVSSSSITTIPFGMNQTLTVVGINGVTNTPSIEDLKALLQETTSSSIKVAYVHWGNEYVHEPSLRQRDFALVLADLGFELVIGHHPHVVQSVERIDKTLVFYSLGNFIFDQYFSEVVREGLTLSVEETAQGTVKVVLAPYESKTARAQPRPMQSEMKDKFLNWLAENSDPTLSQEIKAGEIVLSARLATSTKTAIMVQ